MPAKAHEVEVLARALLGVAAALRAVPGQHRQPQLQGCATDWAAERLAAVARKAGRRLTLPTIEEEGLLPTSLPLGLALLLVACELALPSRHAKSTTKDTARMNECNHVAARDALRGAWEGIERTRGALSATRLHTRLVILFSAYPTRRGCNTRKTGQDPTRSS